MLIVALMSLCLALPEQSIVDLTRGSSIVFLGTVEKLHAATPSVPLQANTAIVRVDEVFAQPPELYNLKARRVTVRFASGSEPSANESLVFFTRVYSAGASIGVDAVGVMRDMSPDQARDELARARETIVDQDIAARLAKADLAVTGVVLNVQRIDSERISEHDPEWATAVVAIRSVEQGTLPDRDARRITIHFASAGDPLFSRWPKLSSGAAGVFILHASDLKVGLASKRSAKTPVGLFVVDPADVQPLDRLERVRRLVKK